MLRPDEAQQLYDLNKKALDLLDRMKKGEEGLILTYLNVCQQEEFVRMAIQARAFNELVAEKMTELAKKRMEEDDVRSQEY